jgi:hypothetical protein
MKANLTSRILLAGIAALAAMSFSAYAGPRHQGGCGCMGDEACIEARRQSAPNCANADAPGCQMQGRGMMNGPGHRHRGDCAAGPSGAAGCPFAQDQPGGAVKPSLPSAPPKAN